MIDLFGRKFESLPFDLTIRRFQYLLQLDKVVNFTLPARFRCRMVVSSQIDVLVQQLVSADVAVEVFACATDRGEISGCNLGEYTVEELVAQLQQSRHLCEGGCVRVCQTLVWQQTQGP